MLEVLVYLIASYLLGAIPFAVIFGYFFSKVDIRFHGSKNAGATNLYRVAGLPAALVAGILDVGKGAFPVWLAGVLFPANSWLPLAAGFAAVAGHIYPVYIGFNGGKGVNTLLGVFLVLLPLEILMALGVFGVVLGIFRIASLGSITAGVSLSVIVVIEKYAIGKNISALLLSACFAVTLLILFTHRANIRRLIRGEELRLKR